MTGVRAPEACKVCDGEGFIISARRDWLGLPAELPCPECCCAVCGAQTDVIDGECGQCTDEADAFAVRRADR